MISILDADFTALNLYISENQFSKIFILCDENTHEYCLPILLGNLEIEIPFELIEIEAGEDLKTIDTAIQLWEILTEYQADRKALLINLGGGVITDIGGFVASTFKRGISFVHIPTTLLSMCDAAIGGKTGVDHGFLKNLMGTFALPEALFLYPNFLKTLPLEQVRSGFAEMLKHGLVADEKHWEALSNINLEDLDQIYPHIETSMMIKQNIVHQDFKEKNIRKILNFGHTIGHAVESLFLQSEKPIPHGEAVALGMMVESTISFLEGQLPEKDYQNIIATISRYFPYINIDKWSNETIFALMLNDKKNENTSIRFSLISRIGSGNYDQQCSQEIVINALDAYRNLKN